MTPIRGVEDHAPFFPVPINQENTAPKSITDETELSGIDSSGSHPDFQPTFQTILDGLMGSGDDTGTVGTDLADSLSLLGLNNDSNVLFSALEQGSTSSQGSGQITDQLLNGFLAASTPLQVQNPNSAQPIADIPTTRVISTYQQAMGEFQKAFNLLPGGNPAASNPNPVNASLIIDSGATTLGVTPQGVTPQGGVNPTQQQVTSYITEQCRQMGIPVQLGLATAATESGMIQFNKDQTPLQNSNPGSSDWGLMQINDRAWGDVYDFNLIKSDWKYNIRAGLQILKESFDAALQNNEGSKGANHTLHNLARAAYSGYNAGVGNIWRYRTPVSEAPQTGSYDVLNSEGYDLRDVRFWENYQKFS